VDKGLEILGKLVKVLLNRRLLVLIAGVAVGLLVLSYAVPPELIVAGARPYLLFLAGAGGAVILVHWGFDADEAIKKHNKMKALEADLKHLAADQSTILLQFVESGKNSIHFSPTNGAVQDLVYNGILYRPEQQLNGLGQIAYNITPQAAKFLGMKNFRKYF
jgi:hypothetical protein